jgi:hypothetical protein
VLNWNQDKKNSSIKEARVYFVEVNINGMIRDFLKIHLEKSRIFYINRKKESVLFHLFQDKILKSLKQNQGTS